MVLQSLKSLVRIGLITLPILLSACGGGGGSSSSGKGPVITLNGSSEVTQGYGLPYEELGASATDEVDGEVDVSISGEVDISTLGQYFVTYTATDSEGNKTQIQRTVNIVDATPPVISLPGSVYITIVHGRDEYVEQGATAEDFIDGIVPVDIGGDIVNSDELGVYTVTYTAQDSAGNKNSVDVEVRVREPLPFVAIWKTDNAGLSGDNQIKITTDPNYDYNYKVIWNDSSLDTNVTGDIVHTYSEPGEYMITISGDFPRIVFPEGESDPLKFLKILSWGEMQWENLDYAFNNCENLVIDPYSGQPDLSKVTSLNYTFQNAHSVTDGVKDWDVSSITEMEGTFKYTASFNDDLSSWDVSNVINMKGMFEGTIRFNQPLNQWDVSNVRNMGFMFHRANAFNQPLAAWDISSVVDMRYMFARTGAFNQDLSDWDTANVTDMSAVFYQANTFNGDISGWDTSNVTSMPNMFFGASKFNQDISSWNTENVTNMEFMFYGAVDFNSDIGDWNVAKVKVFKDMFGSATSFNQDLSDWQTSSAQNMLRMFRSASTFDQDISGWDVSGVFYMNNMLDYSGMSTQNYSKLLTAWSDQDLRLGVALGASGKQYSASAETARNKLINTYNWNITDGGLVAP